MAVSHTFAVLHLLPGTQRVELAEAALREPYLEIQEAAFRFLADPAGINRPELIVLHYSDLLPEIRARVAKRRDEFIGIARGELQGGRERARRGAYQVLAAIGEIDEAPLLSQGLKDESPLVRDHVTGALEKFALRYHSHQINARSTRDSQSSAFIRQKRSGMMAVLREALLSYSVHRKSVFLEVAIEEGPEAYPLISEVVLLQQDGPLAKSFIKILENSPGEATVELLFRLYLDSKSSVRDLALRVMRSRKDEAFAEAVATYLARLSEEAREVLVKRLEEIPWWRCIEVSPNLGIDACIRTIEFLSVSRISNTRRNEMLEHFLRSPHAPVRQLALDTLLAFEHPRALELATRALKDPAEEVCLAAAQAIVRLNPPDKLRLLTPLLNMDSERLRRLATREVATASFSRYMKAFDRMDPKTRELAAKALSKIDSSMHDRLAEEVSGLDSDRRIKALRIVELLGAEKDLREPLMELLGDPDRRVRAAVIKILQLSGDVEGMKLLIGALSDPDRRVRANAVEAFEDIGDTRFAQLLMPFLKDPDNRVRANAAKALWNLGRYEVKDVLEEMLEDSDENMRISAVWAIGELAYKGFITVLEARVDKESSGKVQAKISDVLIRGASPGEA